MVRSLPGAWPALVSSVVWTVTFLLVGRWGARLPVARLAPGPVTALRAFERGGRTWDRWLGVRRWKDRVPDAGTAWGGASKHALVRGGRRQLDRLRAETVRAERVHWVVLASTPLHALWCRPSVMAAMAVFGVVANVPFIVIQRSNRGRIDALRERRARRAARAGTVDLTRGGALAGAGGSPGPTR